MEEVHYRGKGTHWAVVPMKKKKYTAKRPLGKLGVDERTKL